MCHMFIGDCCQCALSVDLVNIKFMLIMLSSGDLGVWFLEASAKFELSSAFLEAILLMQFSSQKTVTFVSNFAPTT